MCDILFLVSLKFLSITAPPAGWEHQTCHLAKMTASIASDGRHMQAWLVKSKKFQDWIRLIWRGPIADPSEICCTGPLPTPVRRCLLVYCEILIELLMTLRSDTTHEKLPRISQEEPFFLLLQNRRHWEIDKSKRWGQGSNWSQAA